ncbi:MAG: thioredoxin domain-containing protein [Homoserinimonas sp.]
MATRLADAVSPYLRSHADNPVDWWPWGGEPFAEARRRGVPVLVSIGYATCHWCHVMARESFSDPALAAYLNEHFVPIKVDREEHPDVDASYLAAASAFTESLGWPLNVFLTPEGRAFYAGTYFPPAAVAGHPSFREILGAIQNAWIDHRAEVEDTASAVVMALAQQAIPEAAELPTEFAAVVEQLEAYEDAEFGGFGGAPKFPVAPVLLFLLSDQAGERGNALALRTLERLASSALRDPIEGGFFRYATRRDWTEPHYERMLYDNAQLLDGYTQAWKLTGAQWAAVTADGVADFLEDVLQLSSGGFASAQDSESVVDGDLTEGDYYSLSASGRARQTPPKRDEKVLAGWNGLAISALARAGFAFDRADWLASARRAADYLLANHLLPDGRLVRASIAGRRSTATATLEDYGMLARGLLDLALATGDSDYAGAGRSLIDATLTGAPDAGIPFAVPGGADPVLVSHGTALAADPSEGAYPSGLTSAASAAHTLYLLTAERRYLDAARKTMGIVAAPAVERPIGFGAALRLMAELATGSVQLVVVAPVDAAESEVIAAARTHRASLVASVTEPQASAFAASGFELFEGRTAPSGAPTAYLCREFVCRLPTTAAADLDA